VLRDLIRPNLQLANLPEPVQRVTLQYAATHDRTDELAGKFTGDVVAAALLDVWDRKVRAPLAQQHPVDPQRWITALIPVAQYIAPVTGPDIDQSLVEDNVLDLARYRLMNEKWVTRIVRDRALAREITKVAKSEYLDTSASRGEGDTLKPASRMYYRWQKKGIEILEAAVSRSLKKPTSRGKSEWKLPDHFVPRERALDELWEAVLETAETGGWVAVVGAPGTGKRTLLTALARDPKIRARFPDGVAVEEVTVEIDARILALRLAASLGKPLPYWIKNAREARRELGEQLNGLRALLVVANVPSLDMLAGLPALGPGVVGVMSVRSLDTVYGMGADTRQVHLGGLTDAEGWSLAQKVSQLSGPNSSQVATARRVLELLEYHPDAVRVAAVRAAADGWERVEDAIQDARARLMELGSVREKRLNVWTSLEAWWGEEKQLGEYLAMVGCLPLLSWYDDYTGAAVWGVSKVEAGVIWGQLARMQLVEVVNRESGRYRLHWLVWDFARQKAKTLSFWDKIPPRLWAWRYPLRPAWSGWQWWKPRLPKPEAGVRWPLWDPRVPGMAGKKAAPLQWWLRERVWPSGLRMSAGPEEWAVTTRTRLRVWAAGAPTIFFALWMWAFYLHIWPVPLPVWAWIAALVACSVAVPAVIDLRRVMWWRLMGRSCSEVD